MTESVDGILLIDKPDDHSSHDVIARLRGVLRTRKVGHAGTLDPIATGLLVCLVGRATKLSRYVTGYRKRYRVTAVLNQMRDTYDRTGELIEERDVAVTAEQFHEVIAAFPRQYDQLPPAYSAKKVGGFRAYKLAREGEEFELKHEPVEINSLSAVGFDFPRFEFEAEVSAGTYVRSLAVDLAAAMGTIAYVEELRRTHVGSFSVDDAEKLEAFLNLSEDAARGRVCPMIDAVGSMYQTKLSAVDGKKFMNGGWVTVVGDDVAVTAVLCEGVVIGIGKIEGLKLKSLRVFSQ